MLNFPIEPGALEEHIPRGTELDNWNGTTYINNVQTNFQPGPGYRTGFGSRTGGAYTSHSLDDLNITYTTRVDGRLDASYPHFNVTTGYGLM